MNKVIFENSDIANSEIYLTVPFYLTFPHGQNRNIPGSKLILSTNLFHPSLFGLYWTGLTLLTVFYFSYFSFFNFGRAVDYAGFKCHLLSAH